MKTAVIAMETLPNYRIKLSFANGSSAVIDMKCRLKALRFQELARESLFQSAILEKGTIIWRDEETEISATVNELLDSMQID